MVKAISLIALLTIAGCNATTGGQFCQVAKPIRPTPADTAAISDRLVGQIVAHNETMQKLCGVKP